MYKLLCTDIIKLDYLCDVMNDYNIHKMKKLILCQFYRLFNLVCSLHKMLMGMVLSRLFNFGWKFHAGDLKDAYSGNDDDSSWRVLDLPHDFQIEQPWDKGAGSSWF